MGLILYLGAGDHLQLSLILFLFRQDAHSYANFDLSEGHYKHILNINQFIYVINNYLSNRTVFGNQLFGRDRFISRSFSNCTDFNFT